METLQILGRVIKLLHLSIRSAFYPLAGKTTGQQLFERVFIPLVGLYFKFKESSFTELKCKVSGIAP
jgi:hypothetical protein